jgi:hypothetical protein
MRSKQTPLTSPRGRHEHDFSLTAVDWEAAVFDRALHYLVVELRSDVRDNAPMAGPRRWRSTKFNYFPWAVRFAQAHRDGCIYAVAASGRFCLIDAEKWDEWEQRWFEVNQVEVADERDRPEADRIARAVG